MDFERVKEIPIVEVLAKRGIALRYNNEWGSAVCPLPSHKSGDKDRTFQVNTRDNYWKCWSQSCNEKAGRKGGDVINLVALFEHCEQNVAAKQLCEMFHINAKAGPHMENRQKPDNKTSKRTNRNDGSPSVEVKGYMADVDAWFEKIFARGDQESDADYRQRVRNAIKTRLVESFRAGKKMAAQPA